MVDFPVARNFDGQRGVGPSGKLLRVSATLIGTLADAVSDAATQRRNLILWPFMMIAGLIVYRLLPTEPTLLTLSVTIFLAAACAIVGRNDAKVREPALLGVLAGLGMMLLPIHGALFGTSMLETARYGTYTARVDAVIFDDGENQRWVLSDVAASGESEEWMVPDVRLARVSVHGDYAVSPGDVIETRIRFYPVPAPAVPGGYDAQFVSYFDGIGAYGNVLGEVSLTSAEEAGLSRFIKDIRAAITARLVAQLGDRIGGIAAALITGDQSRISEADYDVMAEAGIVHVISISGLHLTLVAGTMFAAIRFVLALSHRVPQLLPVKKIAAGFGIVTALAYMLLSGMVIPAVRSTIMLALVFAAIMAGRQALTMRNVAIAALIIIIFEPSSVFRASFQLSFAAVVALIAAYELARRRREEREAPARAKLFRLTVDVAMTSLVAGSATVVFSAYHFQQTAPFGVLGNLMVTPVVSLAMMPSALLGTLLIPIGLDGLPYAVLGWSIETMLWCAGFVSEMSGGFDPSPILAPAALVVTLAGLTWLAYFRDRMRLAGPLLVVPIIALFCMERAPDIFIADQSQAVAIRHNDSVALIAGRNGTFATNIWSERYITPIADGHEATSCDSLGCVLETDQGYSVALVNARSAFDEDCRVADIVIARMDAPEACRATARLVIDATDLARHGAHMIDWNGPDALPRLRTAIDTPLRPWRLGIE
ncbi:ComEC/Rec2 family competence protein [Pelagibacterium sp. H642]|uniref:ComEC/Rec2 family competence protein n=1 Tax=Pelagibacterium sp. H642 TaxID=1881069 RepID=UPI0028160376|nr:ComEC/Rec2 family competence protein [Pelagibacterium sp. H642]WMT90634.1 ComEC/Rec2 family competence protein [Pelagibacterium sp. H642]